jgi:hypothetical protein
MSGFREELRVIPRTAWVVAVLMYLGLAVGIFCGVEYGGDPEMQKWPLVGKVFFAVGLPVLLFALVVLIGYVNGDAKRRGMRHVMWTLLAIFIPDAIGIILYFILRDPLPIPCPTCGAHVLSKFTFCPHCGTPVQPVCPQCGKTVEHAWTNCPHCGTKLPRHTLTAA